MGLNNDIAFYVLVFLLIVIALELIVITFKSRKINDARIAIYNLTEQLKKYDEIEAERCKIISEKDGINSILRDQIRTLQDLLANVEGNVAHAFDNLVVTLKNSESTSVPIEALMLEAHKWRDKQRQRELPLSK